MAKAAEAPKRSLIRQSDVPSMGIEKAIKVAQTIGDNYGYQPATPLQVAGALEQQPTSGGFRMLVGASAAYGLTAGAYNSETIAITELGLRIIRGTPDSDDVLAAKREALLKPRVIREFIKKYVNASLPKQSIGNDILQNMGVPKERADEVQSMIIDSAASVGFIREINGRKYVDLQGTVIAKNGDGDDGNGEQGTPLPTTPPVAIPPTAIPRATALPVVPQVLPAAATSNPDPRLKRVFITHGKNRGLIEPIKQLLSFGELEPVVSVQNPTVSQPVPNKILGEMRSCGAAIIHVDDERSLADKDGNLHVVLNDNVLIEIGAALALYGTRFILVVKEGVKLPSNLQGLLELRYKGDTLDMAETVQLLGAVQDMKKRQLP